MRKPSRPADGPASAAIASRPMPLTGKATIFSRQRARTSSVSLLQTRMAEALRAARRRAGVARHTFWRNVLDHSWRLSRRAKVPISARGTLCPPPTGPQTKGMGRAGAMKLGIQSFENVT